MPEYYKKIEFMCSYFIPYFIECKIGKTKAFGHRNHKLGTNSRKVIGSMSRIENLTHMLLLTPPHLYLYLTGKFRKQKSKIDK